MAGCGCGARVNGCGCKRPSLGKIAGPGARARRGPRVASSLVRHASIGALYHSYGDVATEKQRVYNYLATSVIPAWNACSDSATDSTGQQLSADFNAWYTAWEVFAASGGMETALLPDDDEWNQLQQYETQLVSLVQRINNYCSGSIPGVNPAGTPAVSPVTQIAIVVGILGVGLILFELSPLIFAGAQVIER